ncbi:hypothetical protein GCM10028813_23950 [Ramlibacter alkalitolerans]
MGTTGSTGSAPMTAGTSAGTRSTAVAQNTHSHTHKAKSKKARRVKADRN